MVKPYLALLALLLVGCGSRSLEAARYHGQTALAAAEVESVDREQCRRLDRRSTRLQTWSIVTGTAAGVAAAGTIPTESREA